MKVANMNSCQECFAKFNCKGYCPAKIISITGDIMDTRGVPWCYYTKGIIKQKLIDLLEKEQFKLTEEDYLIFSEPSKLNESDIIPQEIIS